MNRVLFLSDLHLDLSNLERVERFFRFLKEIPQNGDILILGGDIFDLLIGDKEIWRNKYANFFSVIGELEIKNVKIKYLEGNHDFYFSNLFSDFKNVEIFRDNFELCFGAKKISVSHGDLIDPEDKGYLLLRTIFRSKIFEVFLNVVPGGVIESIGKKSSGLSNKYNREDFISEKDKARLRSLYKKFAEQKVQEGVSYVLVGHSHLSDNLMISSGGRTGQYINNGFSSREILFSVLEKSGESFQLKKF